MNVVVVMTGDEEDTGRPLARARAALVEAATGASRRARIRGRRRQSVARRRRPARHDGLDPRRRPARPRTRRRSFSEEVGAGAVFEAARILDAFRTKLAGQAHLTFNPGVLLGGTAVDFNKTAGARHRLRQDERRRRARDGGRRPARAHARSVRSGEEDDGRPSSPSRCRARRPRSCSTKAIRRSRRRRATTELLALYDTVSRSLGLGAVEAVSPDKAGAADVSFVAGQGADDHRRDRAEGPRRSHAGRDRRSHDAAGADQARGRHARAACGWARKSTPRFRRCRHTSAIATTSSIDASRNGAPGRCQSRRAPMNVANVSENSAGPTMPVIVDDAGQRALKLALLGRADTPRHQALRGRSIETPERHHKDADQEPRSRLARGRR